MNILFPFDGKPHSQRAVDLAIKFFNLSKSTVTLLHVVEPLPSDLMMSDKTGTIEETYPGSAEMEAQVLLEFLSKQFEKAGAVVQVRIQHGKPGSEIKAVAETAQIPAIVTTPGKHSPKSLMLESTVTSQLLQVEYEVLLILAREVKSELLDDNSKPTCAFLLDGSEDSTKCLELLAPLVSGKMHILLVASPCAWLNPVSGSMFLRDNPAIAALATKPVEEIMKEASTVLHSRGITFEKMIIEECFEESVAVIEKHRSLGLLVATRSKDDVLHRPLKGAASERLFTNAPCNSALYCAAVSV